MPPDESPPIRHLIVVGASAGGVEAVSELLRSLPSDFGAPVVIAQHLNPDRPSHLGEILGRHSTLPVRVVAQGARPEPGVVYIVPVNWDLAIEDGAFALREPGERRPVPSIDLLLRTASREVGRGLAVVIMSGSGSDGAAGASDVKAAGGTVIIQDPATAGFPSMPRSLAPGTVDAVAGPGAIGPLLSAFIADSPISRVSVDEQQLRLLLARLQQRSGIDFGAYKRPTVQRRLRSRMATTGQATLSDYLRFLDDDPEEYGHLTASFLIKVTEFFRDAKVIRHIRATVLPEILAHARTTRELRIWCAGCATGEEAYTVAMLVLDALGEERDSIEVRIFATDIDPAALAVARRGIYDAAVVAKVPPQMRRRHFTAAGDAYEVAKDVRDLVIFGEHDLGVRPPFPRLDMVLCRNVLIYFTPELQQRVLQVFAYALRERGWLVLGNAESGDTIDDTFVADDPTVRIYRRERAPAIPQPRHSTARLIGDARRLRDWNPMARPVPVRHRKAPLPAGDAVEPVLRHLPVGIITVGPRYETLRINPAARRLLGINAPALGEDIIRLAEPLPAGPLRIALAEASKGRVTTAVHESVVLDPATGASRYLDVTCAP